MDEGSGKSYKSLIHQVGSVRRGTINSEMDGIRVDCFMYSDSRICDICVSSLKMMVPRHRAGVGSDWESYDDDGAQGFYRVVTNEQYKLISSVKDLMELFDGNCVACLMKDNRKIQHSVNSCPDLIGMCNRCLSWDHKAGDCRSKEIKYICGCLTCGFPQNLYGEYMHGDAGTERFRRGFVLVKGCGRGELAALGVQDFIKWRRENSLIGRGGWNRRHGM